MLLPKLDLHLKTQMCVFFLFSIIILIFESSIFTHMSQNTYVLTALIKLPKYVETFTFKYYFEP